MIEMWLSGWIDVWTIVFERLLKIYGYWEAELVKQQKIITTIVINYTNQMNSILTRTTVLMSLITFRAMEVSVFLRRFISLIYLRSAGLQLQRR
jgi:hypothetical protein